MKRILRFELDVGATTCRYINFPAMTYSNPCRFLSDAPSSLCCTLFGVPILNEFRTPCSPYAGNPQRCQACLDHDVTQKPSQTEPPLAKSVLDYQMESLAPSPDDEWIAELVDENEPDGVVELHNKAGTSRIQMPRKAFEWFRKGGAK